jgi:hypothetical protein
VRWVAEAEMRVVYSTGIAAGTKLISKHLSTNLAFTTASKFNKYLFLRQLPRLNRLLGAKESIRYEKL